IGDEADQLMLRVAAARQRRARAADRGELDEVSALHAIARSRSGSGRTDGPGRPGGSDGHTKSSLGSPLLQHLVVSSRDRVYPYGPIHPFPGPPVPPGPPDPPDPPGPPDLPGPSVLSGLVVAREAIVRRAFLAMTGHAKAHVVIDDALGDRLIREVAVACRAI